MKPPNLENVKPNVPAGPLQMNSADSVFLGGPDLAWLSDILRTKIVDRASLIAACIAVRTINVEGVEINLETGLLQRLQSRCIGARKFPDFVRETVKTCLHGFVGW